MKKVNLSNKKPYILNRIVAIILLIILIIMPPLCFSIVKARGGENVESSPIPTVSMLPTPTIEVTPEITPPQTEEPTPKVTPTQEPTPTPTEEPTPKPTKNPTPAPTKESTVNVNGLISLGRYKLTAYCPCKKCSDNWGNKTSTGVRATQGRTIAVDPRVIPYGSIVIINGKEYVAEDCGGAIKGKRIDVYFESHKAAWDFGVQYAEVYIKK